jgi:hypothetical protein
VQPVIILSQPRAGSTLLQRMLGQHPQIATRGEPWLLLPLVDGLAHEGRSAGYDAELQTVALREFLSGIEGGEDIFLRAVGHAAEELYEAASDGADFFVDKTPRYWRIVSLIERALPDAHVIVLLRHPAAVLSSMVASWTFGSDPTPLRKHADDLLRAPRALSRAAASADGRRTVIRYEELVADPRGALKPFFGRLGLDLVDEVIEYGGPQLGRHALGDQETVYREVRPVAARSDAWRARLADPQLWRFTREYLELLGDALVNELGYDAEDARTALAERTPGDEALRHTLSLRDALQPPRARETPVEWLRHSVRVRGWARTISVLRKALVG